MVRKGWWISVILGGALLSSGAPALASEVDILINKLVEKKILTAQEAKEIRREVKEESRRLVQTPEPATPPVPAPEQPKGVLPDWIRNTQWFGNLRLRYEGQLKNYTDDRHRERFRLRLGFKTHPVDSLEVGVRLATGGAGTPTSTNQTLTDTFDNKEIRVDRAYAQFTPWKWLSIIGGKMGIPFKKTDTAWDSDVTPEGVALRLKSQSDGPIQPFATIAAFQVDELSGDAGDPGLLGFQGGARVELPWGRDWSWTPSIAYYDFTGIDGKLPSTITNAPNGNSTDATGSFRDDFDLIHAISKIKIPSLPALNKPVTLLGDWVHNTDAADDDTGYQIGFKVGKVTDQTGSWEASYSWKRLESDATFGALTDGDFGLGGTGHKGHKLGVKVGLAKHWSAALTYFRVDDIEPTAGITRRNNVLQMDTLVSW